MFLRRSLTLGFLAAVSQPLFAAGQVHVVDSAGGAGVDFTNLQAAIDIALDGDVLLLKGGDHSNPLPSTGIVVISGKSLVLVEEDGEAARIVQPVVVENLTFGQEVLLRGIDIEIVDTGVALTAQNNAGDVWVEEATIRSTSTLFPFLPAGDGVRIANSGSVKLVRCAIIGSSNTTGTSPGFDGLESSDSNIALYGCSITGGSGGDGSFFYEGGNGARISGGFLFAQATSFTGGAGGQGSPSELFVNCGDGADGGSGLLLFSSSPTVETLDVAMTGGAGGPAGTGVGSCSAGSPGQALDVASGTHTNHPGLTRSFVASAPTREGETLTLTYVGLPGELVLLDFSVGQGFLWVPDFRGVFSLGFPQYTTKFQGFLDGLGFLVRNVNLGEIGIDGVPLYLQSVFLTPTDVRLGAPSTLVLFDAGI